MHESNKQHIQITMSETMVVEVNATAVKPDGKDAIDKMMDSIKKLRDGQLPTLDACYTVAKLLGDGLKTTINAVIESAENFLKNGKRDIIEMRLEQFNAFTCVSACFALIKSFQKHVLDLHGKVDKKEHTDRIEQIKIKLNDVKERLSNASGKVEKLGVMLKENILYADQNTNAGLYIEFDMNFDLITNELKICEELLNKAKEELAEGFSSVKKYLKRCVTAHAVAGTAIAMPASAIMIAAGTFLVPVIGACLSIGVVAATAIAGMSILAYLAYKFCGAIKSVMGIRDEYHHLDAEVKNLETQLKDLKSKMEAFGNARKVHESEKENTVLKDEKVKDQEKIKRLEEQLEAALQMK